MTLGTFCLAMGERWEEWPWYPCSLEKSENGENLPLRLLLVERQEYKEMYWARKPSPRVGKTEGRIAINRSKNHKKNPHADAAPATTEQRMYCAADFHHIEQWSYAAKQLLSHHNISKESLHSIALFRVPLLLFRCDYAVLHSLQLASEIQIP